MTKIIYFVLVFLLSSNKALHFGDRIDKGLISHEPLSEASGLAASRKNLQVLWTHNDSGDLSRIYAIDANGTYLASFLLKNTKARDWEDIAIGPGPVSGKHYLYIGDIGDNESRFDIKYIYRVAEPEINLLQVPVETELSGVDVIAFRYPDGRRDAETLMVDPLTRDIYIITKREKNVRVYKAPFPQSTEKIITLEHVTNLTLNNVVAGDISTDGREIILKTYGAVYYWYRLSNEDFAQTFGSKPIKIPYVPEPQGEGICWHANAEGYYTISEELGGIPSHLYFYPRLSARDFHK